jgi:hypothetical protein
MPETESCRQKESGGLLACAILPDTSNLFHGPLSIIHLTHWNINSEPTKFMLSPELEHNSA